MSEINRNYVIRMLVNDEICYVYPVCALRVVYLRPFVIVLFLKKKFMRRGGYFKLFLA